MKQQPRYPIETDPAPQDVTFLEERIIEYNYAAAGCRDGELLALFVRDAGGAVTRTLGGEYEAAFLLNPTPMWQVQAVADAVLRARSAPVATSRM